MIFLGFLAYFDGSQLCSKERNLSNIIRGVHRTEFDRSSLYRLNWERQSYRHFRFNEFYGKNRHGVMAILSTETESKLVFGAVLDSKRFIIE